VPINGLGLPCLQYWLRGHFLFVARSDYTTENRNIKPEVVFKVQKMARGASFCLIMGSFKRGKCPFLPDYAPLVLGLGLVLQLGSTVGLLVVILPVNIKRYLLPPPLVASKAMNFNCVISTSCILNRGRCEKGRRLLADTDCHLRRCVIRVSNAQATASK